jgi:hypothetical protein
MIRIVKKRVVSAKREREILAALRSDPKCKALVHRVQKTRQFYAKHAEQGDEEADDALRWRAIYALLEELFTGIPPVLRCLPRHGACALPSGHPGPHDAYAQIPEVTP